LDERGSAALLKKASRSVSFAFIKLCMASLPKTGRNGLECRGFPCNCSGGGPCRAKGRTISKTCPTDAPACSALIASCDAVWRRSRDRADLWIWMLRYRSHHRSILIDAIASHAADATLHVLRNPEAVRRFLADVVRNERRKEPRRAGCNIEQPAGFASVPTQTAVYRPRVS
jgi:hypothetical protein